MPHSVSGMLREDGPSFGRFLYGECRQIGADCQQTRKQEREQCRSDRHALRIG